MSTKLFVVTSSELEQPILGAYTTRELAEKAMVLFIDCVCNDVSIVPVELDSTELPYPEDPHD